MTIDPIIVAGVLAVGAFSGWAGFEWCRATHKQRGIESDRPWTEPLYVPDEWLGVKR